MLGAIFLREAAVGGFHAGSGFFAAPLQNAALGLVGLGQDLALVPRRL